MEREIRKGEGGSDPTASPWISVLEEQVKMATDKLLLTSFPACLEICRPVITAASSCEDADPDRRERVSRVCEEATVIGIQALAEQGAWRDVIPFVELGYRHVAACPAAIMQMCLLLHAHVREYMVCHSLVNSWLDWDDHSSHPDSGTIVGIYVSNVLVPLGAFNLIRQVVEKCSVLTSAERQALLSPRAAASPSVQQRQIKFVPDCGDVNEDRNVPTSNEQHPIDKEDKRMDNGHGTEDKADEDKPKGFKIVSLYLKLSKKLWRNLAKKGWCRQIRQASKLFFLLSFILLAVIHVQTDMTANLSRAIQVWKTAIQVLTSMWRRQPIKHL